MMMNDINDRNFAYLKPRILMLEIKQTKRKRQGETYSMDGAVNRWPHYHSDTLIEALTWGA